MKKLMVTVCALAMLTACAKSKPVQDVSGSEVVSSAASALNNELQSKSIDKVHFAFDKSDLSEEAKSILKSQASALKANQGVAVTIEGHTDQRGTVEYNLGLGERRANAVKQFLANEGVANGVSVTSYGKEKPVDNGITAEAHAQNRRAVTVAN